MAKWSGVIGFAFDTEVEPGVWEETICERRYKGDSIKRRLSFNNSSEINPQINISNQISFVADPYAYKCVGFIRYVSFMRNLWNVIDISFEENRMILTIGGIYNGRKR